MACGRRLLRVRHSTAAATRRAVASRVTRYIRLEPASRFERAIRLPASIVTTPLALRRRHQPVGLFGTAASLAIVAVATLRPQPGQRVGESLCVACGPLGGVDAVLNVLLFIPLGASLALLAWRARHAILGIAALSAAIELIQLFVITGRDASLGDLLMNVAGGAIGFAVIHRAPQLLLPQPRTARLLALAWAGLWIGLQAAVAYALVPALPTSTYHGQLGRYFAGGERFPGRVVAASIGEQPIADGRLPNSKVVARALGAGRSALRATVLTGPPTRSPAPIVRVADEEQREIALLAQRGSAVVFAVRAGAATLRLRPPMFLLDAALPAARTGALSDDTVMISARQDRDGASIEVRSKTASRQQRFSRDLGYGWTLVLPFQWYISATPIERALAVLWMAVTLTPLGYWVRRAQRRDAGARPFETIACLTVTPLVVLAGVVAVPRLFGLPPSPLHVWLAVGAGLMFGAVLASAVARGARRPAPAASG